MWTDPVVETVAPGVHRLPLPMPDEGLRVVNVYAVETDSGLALIDTGWGTEESWSTLSLMLASRGHLITDVAFVLVTHAHEDHMGLAARIQREAGAHVIAGGGERLSIDAVRHHWADNVAARMRFLSTLGADEEAAQNHDQMLREQPDWELRVDFCETDTISEVAGLRLLPTPGHTRGHMCVVDDGRGLVFTGDHVLPHITPAVGFEVCPSKTALADYLQSLEVTRRLEIDRVLPAHGESLGCLAQRVDELLAHHRQRLEMTSSAVRSMRTAREVATRLPWTRHGRDFGELDPFHRMLAVWETWQHLEYLVAAGDLVAERDGAAIHYRTQPGRTER